MLNNARVVGIGKDDNITEVSSFLPLEMPEHISIEILSRYLNPF